MPGGERFFRPARQKIAGILCVVQDFLTRRGGKRSVAWAFWLFSNMAWFFVRKKCRETKTSPTIMMPFDPSLVGRPPYDIAWGKGVGKTMVEEKLAAMGITATREQVKEIMNEIKAEALLTKCLLTEAEVEGIIHRIVG